MSSVNGDELKLYEVRSVSELEDLREGWKHLASNTTTATPFQTWEWNYGIAKFESVRIQLRIVVARNSQGHVVGIAPFCIRPTGWPGVAVLEFIGSRTSDYLDTLFLDAYKESFAHHLLAWIDRNTEWRIVHLQSVRQSAVDWFSKTGAFEISPYDLCPYALLPTTIEQYMSTLPKQLQNLIVRKSRQIAGDARFDFSISRTRGQLESDLSIMFALHQRRQIDRGERGRFFNKAWTEAFYKLSLGFLEAGFLRLGILYIKETPAACVYNLRMRDREYFCWGGMDPTFSRYSPGSVLHYAMIDRAIKDGVVVYDFGRGNDAYKSWWTSGNCQLFQVLRGRSTINALLWRKHVEWRNAIYRSRCVKQVYRTTVGKFRALVEKHHVS